MRYKFFLLVSIHFIVLPLLQAETLTFRLISWEGPIGDLHYMEKQKVIPLQIEEGRLSRSMTYSGSSPLTLFRIVETEEGPQHQPALTMDLPNTKQAILLVSKQPDGSLKGIWIDDSFDYIPLGSIRFHNFSSRPVAIDLKGKDPVMLSPQESYLHLMQENSRTVPILAATTEVDGQWKLFHTVPIPMRSHLRCLVIARNSRTRDARDVAPVELQIIYDQLVPPAM